MCVFEHLSATYVEQQSVTKILTLAFVNLVTPKAGTNNRGLLFNVLALASQPQHKYIQHNNKKRDT
jgi:hypothetical protein